MARNGPTSRVGKTRRGRYLHNHPADDRVVILDIDGVLADLTEFEHLLTRADVAIQQRWRDFFDHIPDAKVLDDGRELAWAIAGLGHTLLYSTTRPAYTRTPTRAWLGVHDFPIARALLARPHVEPPRHPQPAFQIKLAHSRAVTNKHPAWLRCFIDDDQAIVDRLRAQHVPAATATALSSLGVAELRRRLDSAPMKAFDPPPADVLQHSP
ncbi:hypothetical protein [Rhodococcus sp. BS-15]|uniref:hypothetical protein n=1 Tax=Rhodococcus sp. BS-15 TaxID=1304954 RepID=UPI000FFB2591|nr:hypothetical protein [Rhodococcus sp. BS-15]